MKREEIKWALITGASSGIGKELSRLLAEKGINLIIHGRNEAHLLELAQECKGRVQVEVVVADLADRQERMRVIEAICQRAPELVVNNAGFGLYGDALSHSTSEQMQMLEVNGAAVLEITLEASRALIRAGKKGAVLNVASAAAFPVFPAFAVYAASKAFVVQLSQSLDEETSPYGVRILVACPGMVATEFRERAGGTPEVESGRGATMSAAFAAEQIWTQIEKEKKIHIFNWIYRLTTFLVLYLLPKHWVAKSVRNNINKRHPSNPIGQEKHDPF